MLVAGRRFGKSFLSKAEVIRGADGPGKLAWYVAPTLRQAKDTVWGPLKQSLGDYAVKISETDTSIILHSGGKIALRSADKYDSLRGVGLDFLVLDEFADMHPAAWGETFRPMLSDKLGRALFIGTPKGLNHFRDRYDDGLKGEPDWRSWQFTTLQGGRVDPKEVEAARNQLDVKTFQQEYEASFENVSGRVYYAFERKHNVAPCSYSPNLDICWSLDFNIDPMSSVLFQVWPSQSGSGEIRVFDELSLPNTHTQGAVEEFVRRVNALSPMRRLRIRVYGDPAGNQRQHAGPSDWEAVWNGLLRAGFDVVRCVDTSAPGVRDRVNAVNGMLRSAAGLVRLKVDPRCKELIKDFERVAWKTDSQNQAIGEISQADKRSHMSDAIGYAIYREFGARERGGPVTRFIG